MGVSKNSGTPKSSIFIGFSIINHPFWGTPNFLKHPYVFLNLGSTWILDLTVLFRLRPDGKEWQKHGEKVNPKIFPKWWWKNGDG